MGKTLKFADLQKKAVQKEMPLGITEAVFEELEYRPDPENEENVLGAFVHFERFRSIYLPFTNGEINYQLDYLLEQLGCESYAPDDVNKTAGTIVKVSRYIKETEKTLSKAEADELRKKYEHALPTYMALSEAKDGSIIQKNTFTNTNFNLNTIKE